jgi:hypothetical protein
VTETINGRCFYVFAGDRAKRQPTPSVANAALRRRSCAASSNRLAHAFTLMLINSPAASERHSAESKFLSRLLRQPKFFEWKLFYGLACLVFSMVLIVLSVLTVGERA